MTNEGYSKEDIELFLMKAGTCARVYYPGKGFITVKTNLRENIELVEDGVWAIDKFCQQVKEFHGLAHDLLDKYKYRTKSLANCEYIIQELNYRWLAIMDSWQLLNPYFSDIFSKVLKETIVECETLKDALKKMEQAKEQKEKEEVKNEDLTG